MVRICGPGSAPGSTGALGTSWPPKRDGQVRQVACLVLAADQLAQRAGIAAGSTVTSGLRVHHTRPPTRGPHDGPHDRGLAWAATDGAVAPLSATALARMAGARSCWRPAMAGGALPPEGGA